MLDFLKISASQKGETTTIWPEFLVKKSNDLMIRGGKFYAIWDEEAGLWSTSEYRATEIIDEEIDKATLETKAKYPEDIVRSMKLLNSSSKRYREWRLYISSLPDSFVPLDEKVTFANTKVKKTDYVSKRLDFPIVREKTPCYNELISTLYDPTEREKLEWAIGSIIAGDSRRIQKFIVLYGDKGAGKSTILNIYQEVLKGYWSVFNSKALGNPASRFALEPFKNNPIMAIEHDGDLSKIEDNTRLNSLVSHEPIEIDVKNQNLFYMSINSFLFMGTNRPVKITDSKSGLLRRLIDVNPSGRKIPTEKYYDLIEKVKFELGGIAYHCLKVYKDLGMTYYDTYSPTTMISVTNEFFNFVEDADNFFYFKEQGNTEDGVSLDTAWARYNQYVESSRVPYPFSKRVFKEELRSYFKSFEPTRRGNGIYKGFKEERFDFNWVGKKKEEEEKELAEKQESKSWLEFDGKGESIFDETFSEIKAQYCWVDADGSEKPKAGWDTVETTLSDIDPTIVHYCRPPGYIIILDFDEKDEEGNKSLELNLKAARSFPPTYAEVSKGGNGLHLCYIYDGDVSDLSDHFSDNIEIKTFLKKESLRRRLSLYNSLPIAHISSGLPLKKEAKKTVTTNQFESESKLRNTIKKCLRKEVHKYTVMNINMIKHITDEAYESGEPYDIRDLRGPIQIFAAGSHNNRIYCLRTFATMHFCSKNYEEAEKNEVQDFGDEYYKDELSNEERKIWEEAPIAIFDWEVMKNMCCLCYKIYDPPGSTTKHEVVGILNPKPDEVSRFHKTHRAVGFNNLNYDNFISQGRILGYSNAQLYELSQKLIAGTKEDRRSIGMYSSKKLSYSDILDFSHNKKSLKWFEVHLDVPHRELAFKWDEPVPEEMWDKVVEYCKNDVLATEAVWNSDGSVDPDINLQDDWFARKMLAAISGLTVNDTDNTHSAKIIFGNNKHPQSEFIYTDLSTIFPGYMHVPTGINPDLYNKDKDGKPIYTTGKSIFMGEDPSEGGYNWSKPGIYGNVKAYDVASMHPSTVIALNLFGERYTAIFKQIVDLRLALKHKDEEAALKAFNGILKPLLTDAKAYKGAAAALKIVINAVYGMSSAPFPNIFKDERNIDNIVAKRGALFMIQLKHKVQEMGYEVVHCKTDCIKVADADERLDAFIFEEGRKYGYTFEVEDWFDKFFLVNKSAYIGRLRDKDGNLLGWISKADEFNEPYTFKTLFSKEPVEFKDLIQTKQVKSAMYIDMNEDIPQMDPALLKELAKLDKKKKAYSSLIKTEGEAYDKYLKTYKSDFTAFEEDRLIFLSSLEKETHKYIFVGRFGAFCPVLPGYGGGVLVRDQDGKMDSVQGCKGYRWLEAELIKEKHLEHIIDMSYFESLANTAKKDIMEYGDFDWFVSDEPYKGVVPLPLYATKALKDQADDILRQRSVA